MHQDFQFQYSPVESSWGQKIAQFATREVLNRGIPDELTFVLGAFSIYASIGRATFHKIPGGTSATVTHVHIYVRDSFDFLDRPGEVSQYLGHWSVAGVSILPLAEIKGLRSLVDTPGLVRAIRIDRQFWYSVRNSDFREWQEKHQKGGDFILYSDTVSRMLPKPISVVIPDSDV